MTSEPEPTHPANPTPAEIAAPGTGNGRWFPGYTVAGVGALAMLASAPGQTMIVALLNAPLREMLGLTEGNAYKLNIAYTVATVAAAIPLVLVGRLTDAYGPRKTLAWVAGLFAASCLVLAGSFNLLTVFIGFFLVRFLGAGALGLVAQHAIAMWFHRRLGSINGFKQVVIFGLWIPAPVASAWLIANLGWRSAYVLFAVLVAVSVIPPTLRFLRDRPEDLGLRMDNDPAPATTSTHDPEAGTFVERFGEERPDPTGAGPFPADRGTPATSATEPAFTMREALRTRAYWLIASAFLISPLIGTALLFDLQPIVASLGVDLVARPELAAWPASAWLAAMTVMALPAGLLTDRLRPSRLLPVGMGAIALSPAVFAVTVLLPDSAGLAGAIVAMIVFAVGQSIVAACGSAAVARYYGRAHHGAIRSSLTRIGLIGTGLGPAVAAGPVWLAATLGSTQSTGYFWVMLIFIAVAVPPTLALTRIREPEAPVETNA
ncbi:MAG: MFS transporter [Phycisphaerales bacterium]|nr:MAG: MFS transporter [Phycisphaerales bacterium]